MLSTNANAENKLELLPIYGWGWFTESGSAVDVPEKLTIELSKGNNREGVIIFPKQYIGQQVHIEKRSESDNIIHYNVVIYNPNKEVEVTGFAQSI